MKMPSVLAILAEGEELTGTGVTADSDTHRLIEDDLN
jgi:hypothetical protein